jgi:hypothetical protein
MLQKITDIWADPRRVRRKDRRLTRALLQCRLLLPASPPFSIVDILWATRTALFGKAAQMRWAAGLQAGLPHSLASVSWTLASVCRRRNVDWIKTI